VPAVDDDIYFGKSPLQKASEAELDFLRVWAKMTKKLMEHTFLETAELYVATSMEKARKEYEGSHELMGWLRSDLNQPIRDNRL